MMHGLLLKARHETLAPTLGGMLAMIAVTAMLTRILPEMQQGLNDFLLQMPFMRTMLGAMFGLEFDEGITTRMLLSIIWTHPVVLSIVWAFAIAHGSRVPAGEIDRGTIDVLLGWPVTRGAVHRAETIAGAVGVGLVSACGLIGFVISAGAIEAASRPAFWRVAIALANLAATGVVVLALAQLCSVLSARRGRAVGAALTVVLASFLLQFVAQFWSAAQWVEIFALPHYYQPAQIVGSGTVPTGDLAVLGATALVLWLVAGALLRRRDILTA